MNDNVIIKNSANDFTVRMSIRRTDIDKEIAILRGQINLLQTQGIITEETENLLWNQLQEVIVCKNKIESDYYDMRNKLESYEKTEEKHLLWLKTITHEDSARGQFAREIIDNFNKNKE